MVIVQVSIMFSEISRCILLLGIFLSYHYPLLALMMKIQVVYSGCTSKCYMVTNKGTTKLMNF